MDKKLALLLALSTVAPLSRGPTAPVIARPLDTTPDEVLRVVYRLSQRPRFRNLAARRHVDLHDAVGNACVRALENLASYDASVGRLDSWLGIILYHAIEDLGRSRARHGRVRSLTGTNGDALQVAARVPSISDEASNKDLLVAVRTQLQSASPLVQAVFWLRVELGWTFDRIARHLGHRRSVVTGRWFAWCRQVRRRFDREE